MMVRIRDERSATSVAPPLSRSASSGATRVARTAGISAATSVAPSADEDRDDDGAGS